MCTYVQQLVCYTLLDVDVVRLLLRASQPAEMISILIQMLMRLASQLLEIPLTNVIMVGNSSYIVNSESHSGVKRLEYTRFK